MSVSFNVEGPVFSPSQTSEWSRCPVLWKLHREGWRSSSLGNKELAGVMGTGFAKAMEVYNLVVQDVGFERVRKDTACFTATRLQAVDAAIETAQKELQGLVDLGFSLVDSGAAEDIPAILQKAISRFMQDDPTPSTWTVDSVEKTMKEHGRARADVVYKMPDGGRVVRDYKFKKQLGYDYVAKTLTEYGDSSQTQHYLWMHDAIRFEYCVVVSAPFKIHLHPVDRDDERLAQWLASQKEKWGFIEEMRQGYWQPWENDQHSDKYGPCEFQTACLQYHRDPARMALDGFIQIRRVDV